jgi:hypothetical protein
MNKLASIFIKKAKEEVREDESRREQSLEQFREWIKKHPFISNVKTGEIEFSLE